MQSLSRPFLFRLARPAIVASLALTAWVGLVSLTGPAFAQAQECEALGKIFSKRQAVIDQINGFQKKHATPDVACSAFTKLGQLNAETIKALEKDGAWCHAPTEVLPSLQAQSEQIAEAKKNACGAADQQRKAQSDAKSHNPLAGSDSVIGGQIKMPKGAL
jgi:hypothetical protein